MDAFMALIKRIRILSNQAHWIFRFKSLIDGRGRLAKLSEMTLGTLSGRNCVTPSGNFSKIRAPITIDRKISSR